MIIDQCHLTSCPKLDRQDEESMKADNALDNPRTRISHRKQSTSSRETSHRGGVEKGESRMRDAERAGKGGVSGRVNTRRRTYLSPSPMWIGQRRKQGRIASTRSAQSEATDLPTARSLGRSTEAATNTGGAAAWFALPSPPPLRPFLLPPTTSASASAALAILSLEFQNLKRFHFASTHDNAAAAAAAR